MPWRGTTPPLAGLMAGHIAATPPGITVNTFTIENILTEVIFRLTNPPTGGSLVVELNDLADGTGDLHQTTFAAGETFKKEVGLSISVGALYLIVRSEGGDDTSMNLSGEYTMNSVEGVTDPFTTLAKVKLDADIAGADANRDTVINSIIAGVTRQMQDYIGRDIVQGTATDEKIGSTGSNLIQTKNYPLLAVTALEENGTALVEDTDFEMEEHDLERGQIARISGTEPIGWLSGRRIVKTTYDHGFVTIPDSLVRAATSLVVAKYNETVQSGKGWGGVLSKGVDPNATVTYDKEIWQRETIPAMEPFRRWVA